MIACLPPLERHIRKQIGMKKEHVYFNPGCALSLYKPEKELQIASYLRRVYNEDVQLHKICCRHNPQLPEDSTIINVCSGCNRRFSSLYEGIHTVSLWEIIDNYGNFPFPDYADMSMSIQDACPVREKPAILKAVRNLAKKMNISMEETKYHGAKSICCGDELYGHLPLDQVHAHMRKRADSMPCEHVIVYCISCIKAMYIGGKKPRHLVDLLFNETTDPQEFRTVEWHQQLKEYIECH
jgi:hypothetical protein